MKKILITLLCLSPLITFSAEYHKYQVYYPVNCEFISGSYERSHYYTNYQVECKEGGDLSTYVSAPAKIMTPAKFTHFPANIKGFIYLKEVK